MRSLFSAMPHFHENISYGLHFVEHTAAFKKIAVVFQSVVRKNATMPVLPCMQALHLDAPA